MGCIIVCNRRIERSDIRAHLFDIIAIRRSVDGSPDDDVLIIGALLRKEQRIRAIIYEYGIAGKRRAVTVREIRRRGDDTRRIHDRSAVEQHAVRVDEDKAADGVDIAADGRGRIAGDMVQRHGTHARLDEIHRRVLADVEAVPIDDGIVGCLRDVHRTLIIDIRNGCRAGYGSHIGMVRCLLCLYWHSIRSSCRCRPCRYARRRRRIRIYRAHSTADADRRRGEAE